MPFNHQNLKHRQSHSDDIYIEVIYCFLKRGKATC